MHDRSLGGQAGLDAGAALDALDALSLPELEEAAGELQRRVAVALRRLGEQGADRSDLDGRTARWRVASLAAGLEQAGASLAAVAAGVDGPSRRLDAHPAVVAALMYAAPTTVALAARLEQDRRLLASLARSLEARLEDEAPTPWGTLPLRRLLSEVLIAEPARCALALEREAGRAEA